MAADSVAVTSLEAKDNISVPKVASSQRRFNGSWEKISKGENGWPVEGEFPFWDWVDDDGFHFDDDDDDDDDDDADGYIILMD